MAISEHGKLLGSFFLPVSCKLLDKSERLHSEEDSNLHHILLVQRGEHVAHRLSCHSEREHQVGQKG